MRFLIAVFLGLYTFSTLAIAKCDDTARLGNTTSVLVSGALRGGGAIEIVQELDDMVDLLFSSTGSKLQVRCPKEGTISWSITTSTTRATILDSCRIGLVPISGSLNVMRSRSGEKLTDINIVAGSRSNKVEISGGSYSYYLGQDTDGNPAEIKEITLDKLSGSFVPLSNFNALLRWKDGNKRDSLVRIKSNIGNSNSSISIDGVFTSIDMSNDQATGTVQFTTGNRTTNLDVNSYHGCANAKTVPDGRAIGQLRFDRI